MSIVLIAVITLGIIGVVSATILYVAAQKFKVEEDPRIDQVEEILPAANCGGCGFPGCRGFAEALVKADDFTGMNCPVGGAAVMEKAANVLGKVAVKSDPLIAVLRCQGTCENRPKTNIYNGADSCKIAASLYGGESACSFGCHGLGDCVDVCDFDALHIDPTTGIPVVSEDNCVACGACVKACPTNLFELRKKGPKSRRVYVGCRNEDKGAPAKKACATACIGCGKCEKECQFGAITIANNLAFIDTHKCKLCRKCAPVCPTNAIIEVNFPPRKEKVAEPTSPEVKQ